MVHMCMGVWELCAWGACMGVVCVCVCVCGGEVVFAGQAKIVRDSLRVGSESKILLAIKNCHFFV
jgi:hypothetical protein